MQVLKITEKNFKEIIKITLKFIKNGKVVIFPTDTVYGLVCDVTNKKAVRKLFKIKNRPIKKPVPIFVKDIKTAKKLAIVNKEQEKLLKKYWPGKTTVVFKKTRLRAVFTNASARQGNTIAIRIPKYKPLNILLNKLNFPLAQTSVNFSGKSPIANAGEALKLFNRRKNKPDLIIDGGKLKNKSSKIIDLTVNPPKILRP